MKAYTDLNQSKKLAEFLPVESADMVYNMVNGYNTPWVRIEGIEGLHKEDVCSWSLAALLSIIPDVSLNSFKDGGWNVMTSQTNDGKMIYADKKDPVDACYELILKFHEQNIL